MNIQNKLQEIINTTSSEEFLDIMINGDAKLIEFLKSGDHDAHEVALLIKRQQIEIYREIKEREAIIQLTTSS